jgi:hypothetical protein
MQEVSGKRNPAVHGTTRRGTREWQPFETPENVDLMPLHLRQQLDQLLFEPSIIGNALYEFASNELQNWTDGMLVRMQVLEERHHPRRVPMPAALRTLSRRMQPLDQLRTKADRQGLHTAGRVDAGGIGLSMVQDEKVVVVDGNRSSINPTPLLTTPCGTDRQRMGAGAKGCLRGASPENAALSTPSRLE